MQFNDNKESSIIEYFIYDLDFGEKFNEGCVLNSEGLSINLASPSDLYDYLVSNL